MKSKLRPSNAGKFYQCPYAFKHTGGFVETEKSLEAVRLGTLMHGPFRGMNNISNLAFHLEYYKDYYHSEEWTKSKKPYSELKRIYERLYAAIYTFYCNTLKGNIIDSEMDIYFKTPYGEIEGSPDVVTIETINDENVYVIRDCKTAASYSFYKDIFDISMQPYIYCLGIMKRTETRKCIFRFAVFSKFAARTTSNAGYRIFEKEITYEEAEERIQTVYGDYEYCEAADERECREGGHCWMCSMGKKGNRKCPLI